VRVFCSAGNGSAPASQRIMVETIDPTSDHFHAPDEEHSTTPKVAPQNSRSPAIKVRSVG
jgi:hypothetical protein